MSALFQSGAFEYQLPTAVGASTGATIALQENGVLGFSQSYTGLCNVNFTQPVIGGCTLSIVACGKTAQVFITAPDSGALWFAVDGSLPTWGSLTNLSVPIPDSLLPVGSVTLGVIPMLSLIGESFGIQTLYVSMTGVGSGLPPGVISLNSVTAIQSGTYLLGALAQVNGNGAAQTVCLGSYMIA